jgi:hypothetical protein
MTEMTEKTRAILDGLVADGRISSWTEEPCSCGEGFPYEETRAGVTALIHECEESIQAGRQVTCTECGAPVVDDDRSPFYEVATDDGTPHQCPPVNCR